MKTPRVLNVYFSKNREIGFNSEMIFWIPSHSESVVIYLPAHTDLLDDLKSAGAWQLMKNTPSFFLENLPIR